jgi:hypothetical protein
MIKIFISVRNRLAITKKCIEAIKRHSDLPHQIYVYDNATNYRVAEHFKYFAEMYAKGEVSQICFTSEDTTFRAFSKASTCNFFGQQHNQDPKRDEYTFLVMLDNDIIVMPNWDSKLKQGWKYVNKNKMKNFKVIGQRPGGIKHLEKTIHTIGDMTAKVGRLGGSGLWSVRPDFFKDVGFLNLNSLVGHDKKHDQHYWILMEKASGGKPYIMGLQTKLGIHTGPATGSVCNRLNRNRGNPKKGNLIKFENQEKKIDGMNFEEFMNYIKQRRLASGW